MILTMGPHASQVGEKEREGKMIHTEYDILRLVALVILQTHPLKQNIPSSHQDFAVQRQFPRTRHPLYLILHTNKHPWDPLIKFF
jgi:hypothetical protein